MKETACNLVVAMSTRTQGEGAAVTAHEEGMSTKKKDSHLLASKKTVKCRCGQQFEVLHDDAPHTCQKCWLHGP